MNGAHDLGGDHGHGPIAPDPNEPLFRGEWERRCFAITLAMGFTGQWNIDQARFARESMRPGRYLETSYYEHWLHGLEVLLSERDLVSPEEIAAGAPAAPSKPLPRILAGDAVAQALAKGGSARREPDAATPPAMFKPGDIVRAKTINPPTHTRLPRYARGRRGVIARTHGLFVYPDTHAANAYEAPGWLHAVRFEAQELWGPDAEPGVATYIDLWDAYLEPA
jgi:nitrile hydratase beta subunit